MFDTTDEVCVYKNLNNGKWSVTGVKGNDNRGRLLGHADTLTLTGCRMVVKESRRQSIVRGNHREVCAWIIGKIADDTQVMSDPQKVTFRPRERETFFNAITGESVLNADAILFDQGGTCYTSGADA